MFLLNPPFIWGIFGFSLATESFSGFDYQIGTQDLPSSHK